MILVLAVLAACATACLVGPQERQHLYFAGEHVGWLMPANRKGRVRGLTLPDIAARTEILKGLSKDGTAWAVLACLAHPQIDGIDYILAAADEIRASMGADS